MPGHGIVRIDASTREQSYLSADKRNHASAPTLPVHEQSGISHIVRKGLSGKKEEMKGGNMTRKI